jgi:hypothetical protein
LVGSTEEFIKQDIKMLKCHILIDLKTKKFKHTDAGQMNFYLNYYKDQEMNEADNPPADIRFNFHLPGN